MANANTPYIAKNAAPLVNPTTQSVFLQTLQPVASVAATITQQAAYVKWEAWSAPGGAGTSNWTNLSRFRVSAAGRAVGGTTTNFTPAIQFGRSTTAGNNINFATFTATAFNSAPGNWAIDVSVLYDPFSGQINGLASGIAGSNGAQTILAPTTITPITGQTIVSPAANVAAPFSTGELQFFFSATGLFSVSNANNMAYLDFFQVEDL